MQDSDDSESEADTAARPSTTTPGDICLVTAGGDITQEEIDTVKYSVPVVKATVQNEDATREREAVQRTLVAEETHEYVEGLQAEEPEIQHEEMNQQSKLNLLRINERHKLRAQGSLKF